MTSPNTILSEKTALGTHATQDKTPLEMLYQWEKNNPSDIFLRQSLGEKGWEELTWQQVSDQVRRVANYIKNKNLPDSSNIAIWSTNNMDWVIVDLAIMLSGHVSVPLYPGQSVEGVQYILAETECQLIFLGECHQEHQIDEALPDDVQRIGIRGCKVPCHASLSEVISESQPYAESPIPGHDQLMTIVYSSGTSGNPKGVTHVHGTPAGLTPILARIFGLTTDEGQPTQAKLFSFLPLSHMAERGMVEMTALYSNAPISFSAGLESFNQEIQEVQPTFFFAVPRLWHKFKSAIESKLGHLDPERLPDAHKAMIRQQLGLAEAHFIISASAPIPTLVQKWFLALGIVLREAYGMTETFSSGCCWYKDNLPEAGSVGTAHEGAEIKLSEEGEVLMRSKGMMTGYYKNPQLTAEVLTDGWFHTGDLGQLDSAGNLRITGRVGSIFKNSKGKFVNPEKVEKHFQKIKEFEQMVLIGEGLELPILVATLSEQAREESIERLQTQITTELDEINSNLAAEERVSKIIVVPEDWNIDNGFLTPTLKLKRKKVATHYHPAVSSAGKDEKVIFLGR